MTKIRYTIRTLVLAGAAIMVGQFGIAPAAAFDEWAFSTCTLKNAPPAGQDFDAVATSCCVDNAGVPTGTRYGVGCTAPVVDPSPDYRPTIYMPNRPAPPEDSEPGTDVALDELMKLPPLPEDVPFP